MPFHPFYTAKDGWFLGLVLVIFAGFVFFAPNALGHPDNYIEANPLSTPAHIVPEWYFLPFYAILRAFTGDLVIPFTNVVLVEARLLGVIGMFGSILVWFILPWLDKSPVRSGSFRPMFKKSFWGLVVTMIVLTICGGAPAEQPYILISQLATAYYFLHFLVILPIVSQIEVPKPLPYSITEAVLGGDPKSATAPAPEAPSGGAASGGLTDGGLQPAE